MGEVLVKVNGIGTNPAEIARRKSAIVDLAKLHSALSSNVTSLTFNSITVHIWFGDATRAQTFVAACESHRPFISIEPPRLHELDPKN